MNLPNQNNEKINKQWTEAIKDIDFILDEKIKWTPITKTLVVEISFGYIKGGILFIYVWHDKEVIFSSLKEMVEGTDAGPEFIGLFWRESKVVKKYNAVYYILEPCVPIIDYLVQMKFKKRPANNYIMNIQKPKGEPLGVQALPQNLFQKYRNFGENCF